MSKRKGKKDFIAEVARRSGRIPVWRRAGFHVFDHDCQHEKPLEKKMRKKILEFKKKKAEKQLFLDLIESLMYSGNELRIMSQNTNHMIKVLDGDGAFLKADVKNFLRRIKDIFGVEINIRKDFNDNMLKIYESLRS